MKITWPRLKSGDDYLHLFIKLGLILALLVPLIAPIFAKQMQGYDYYFPFIVPRNLYWRLLVEIIFASYLILAIRHKLARPRLNQAYNFFILFVITLFISSLFAQNFIFSFWSNFERMDGLVNWIHLLMYVFVLAAYLGQQTKSWQALMRVSVGVAILVSLHALGQQLGLSWLIASAGGGRLTATLGNAAYVGSYLFLHLVILSYLLIQKIRAKQFLSFGSWYYLLAALLFLYILVATQTRGPFLALLFFVFFMVIAYLWFQRRQKNKVYYLVVALLLGMILFVAFLFWQKQSAFVQSVPLFQKISNISLNDTSTESRLYIWRQSLLAAKEKPIFGWGEENFIYAFNKYFPPQIYNGLGSETWFDRPHNILVQHLIHGGILAVSLYLAIFIYLIFLLYRQYQKDHDWLINFLWIGFLLSFLLQDLFIFDNLSVSVVFYLLLAFLIATLSVDKVSFWSKVTLLGQTILAPINNKIKASQNILVLIVVLLFVWVAKEIVYEPWLSNKILIKSLRKTYTAATVLDFTNIKNDWQRTVDLTSLGDKEKVEVLLQIFQVVLNNQAATNDVKKDFFVLTGSSFEDMADKYPEDVRFNMILSNFYNNLVRIEPAFLEKNIALLERLVAYAPSRPDIKMSLTEAYLGAGDLEKAKNVALEAKDLVPDVKEIYWNLAYVYWQAKDIEHFDITLKKVAVINMQKIGINFEQADLARLQYFLSQTDKEKDQDLYKLIQSFLPKEQ